MGEVREEGLGVEILAFPDDASGKLHILYLRF